MKKMHLLIIVLFLSFSSMAQFSNAKLQASGLTCAMCSKAVKVALEKVAFVQKVEVDIKSQEYSLSFKENSDADFDALKKAVEDAGFSIASLKITGNFSNLTIQKDKHIQVFGKNFHFLNTDDQLINGEKTFSLVEKDFLTEKDFKKLKISSKMDCVKTGKAENCCIKDGISANSRIYHVKI